MKIGIDTNSTQGKKTGLGVYTENILRYLRQELDGTYDLRCYAESADKPWNTARRLFWENIELPWKAAKDKIDLLHVPAFSPPLMKPCKLVVTVHDLIGVMFPNQLGWASRFYWGKWLPARVRSADRIIADSESTKRDIIRQLKYPETKIDVIYLSGHERFQELQEPENLFRLKKSLGIRSEYFLSVGTIEPRKNLSRVLKAFAGFQKKVSKGSDYQLVIAGSKYFGHGQGFQILVDESKVPLDDVIFSDYLSDHDLNLLYSGAIALVFPSLYEGFGMPVLEAMGAGTAVITSKVSSLPEVAGEAALLVDPYQESQIEDALVRVVKDSGLRESMIKKGRDHRRRFSWKKTAQQTIEVYKKVMGR